MALKASRDRLISLESCCEKADQAMINAAQDEIEVNVRILLPPANEVWGKVIFLHLSVILFTGGVCLSACWDTTPRTMHPPGPCTPRDHAPPQDHAPPGTMHFPRDHAPLPKWDHAHTPQDHALPPRDHSPPPPRTMHPPSLGPCTPLAQSMLGDTVNARAVRILLECNFVFSLKMKI